MLHSELFLQKELFERKKQNSLRSLKSFQGTDFFSNDYLGFARSSQILEKYQKKILNLNQLGATASRLLGGHHSLHGSLEQRIAQIFKAQDALLFSSGYLANLGLIQCLCKNHPIVMDELCHNSMKNGAKLSGSRTLLFRHNDLEHLEKRLKTNVGSIVLVESVYSMDGDRASLKEIVMLAKKYKAEVVVDEAHAIGVLGPEGKGLIVQEGLENDVLARIVTFGKAFGAEGAAVLGSKLLKHFLINFCQSFIYTTGVSHPNLLMLESALEHFSTSTIELKNLLYNIHLFIETSGQNLSSPIFAWNVPGNNEVKSRASLLYEDGITVWPILSPTVRRGSERLRIVLHSFNTKEEVQKLANFVRRYE